MNPERRKNARFPVNVPVEIHTEGSDIPIRCAISELSLDGCYVETMFPFPNGTSLDLKLQLEEDAVLITATVITSFPQVGNGFQFVQILPEDREVMRAYLEALAKKEEEAGKDQ
ncbi:MAG TPA: PilZ domain-containing protein [Terriglobales bacterium]|nr:PilZ domain-containing protein [Terriglobales bacterium]